ncbi:MAG: type I secretion system permease/ATPase [Alphaproteobacteria bacterium]
MLECLVFLTAHYGRAKSAQALTAGLPYDTKNMGPELFCTAAGRLGLKTQITKRADIGRIPTAILPAVLVLKGDRACVLLAVSAGGKAVRIFDPETKATRETDFDDLKKSYAGYAIFVQPRSEFTNPESFDPEDPHRHWFWSLVRENRSIYGMALLGAVFINLFGLASPLFVMNVYDRVIPNNAIDTGWVLGIGALAVFVFDFIMRTLRAYLIDLAGRRMDVIAGRRIYDQLLNMKIAGRPKSSGAFANMLRDFDSVREFFTSATMTGFVDLPFTLFFLFIIYQLGGGLVFVLIGLIGLVLLAGAILQGPLKHFVRKATRSSEAKHGLLVETISGLETIKAAGADGRFRARYGDYLAENAAYGQGSRFISGLGINIATFLQQITSIVIVLSGMYMVRDMELTMGGLIACVILGGRAIAPIGQIANLMTRYHQAGSALKTLEAIMNKPVERPAGRQFLHRPDLQGKIAFDAVSFSYPGTDREALRAISFTIEKGEKIGIIGRIGSGKSTLARLIMGLYEPDSGTILADDTDYRQIDPADLRRNVAYIAQDVVLFRGSVRDNITASMPHAGEEAILDVAKASGVHDFVARHPMGYDAPVGEHGEGLSGGQRQAVALARAMLLRPGVMLCDEPTNAMDMQAEEAFKRYVQKEIGDKTFIMITHRHTMLELVDRLILLDEGRVVMDGPRGKVLDALQAGRVEVQKG